MPGAVEIEILNQLTELLKPFEYVTREASGQKYVTISKIIPMLICLNTQLRSMTPNSTAVKECKEVLQREVNKRYGLIEYNASPSLAIGPKV